MLEFENMFSFDTTTFLTAENLMSSLSTGQGDLSSILATPVTIQVKYVCAFCEVTYDFHPKSREVVQVEEMAVEHFKRRVLCVGEELLGDAALVFPDDQDNRYRKLLSSVTLCDECVTRFARREEAGLQDQLSYLEKITGTRRMEDIFNDPLLDLKKLAFHKLRGQAQTIREKLQLIETVLAPQAGSSSATVPAASTAPETVTVMSPAEGVGSSASSTSSASHQSKVTSPAREEESTNVNQSDSEKEAEGTTTSAAAATSSTVRTAEETTSASTENPLVSTSAATSPESAETSTPNVPVSNVKSTGKTKAKKSTVEPSNVSPPQPPLPSSSAVPSPAGSLVSETGKNTEAEKSEFKSPLKGKKGKKAGSKKGKKKIETNSASFATSTPLQPPPAIASTSKSAANIYSTPVKVGLTSAAMSPVVRLNKLDGSLTPNRSGSSTPGRNSTFSTSSSKLSNAYVPEEIVEVLMREDNEDNDENSNVEGSPQESLLSIRTPPPPPAPTPKNKKKKKNAQDQSAELAMHIDNSGDLSDRVEGSLKEMPLSSRSSTPAASTSKNKKKKKVHEQSTELAMHVEDSEDPSDRVEGSLQEMPLSSRSSTPAPSTSKNKKKIHDSSDNSESDSQSVRVRKQFSAKKRNEAKLKRQSESQESQKQQKRKRQQSIDFTSPSAVPTRKVLRIDSDSELTLASGNGSPKKVFKIGNRYLTDPSSGSSSSSEEEYQPAQTQESDSE